MIDLFIPSYHRPKNLKTVKFFLKVGYDPKKIHVFVDDEASDLEEYKEETNRFAVNLHVFDMEEARDRYDYVHRPSHSRRSAGQARNMFYDFAKKSGISFYVIQDDDTRAMENKYYGKYKGVSSLDNILISFYGIKEMMEKRRIGFFGMPQTGDMIGGMSKKLLINKVMNTTFVNTKYVYRPERGVQNNDTSAFASIMNNGLFTGSLGDGVTLNQEQSATCEGGLTDLYNECKLLNKALVPVIQFPSAIKATYQPKNGGRLHHAITSKYLYPRLIKNPKGRDNIAWDSYPEDWPFTNEPKRKK